VAPIWEATRAATDDSSEEVLVELDPDDRPPYGIITTQSCDIDEEGSPRRPWVEVAPVYQLTDADQRLGSIRHWKVTYMVPITELGPTWVGDLRIEFPIEKSWLVQHEPRSAFSTYEDFAKFSERCGMVRARPAIDSTIEQAVIEELKRELRNLRRADRTLFTLFRDEVEHLFIAISGDPLSPKTVQLVFVSRATFPAELIAVLNAWWERVFGGSGALRFTVLPSRFLALNDSVPIADQRRWVSWDVTRLLD
jgi:hypothetical protein